MDEQLRKIFKSFEGFNFKYSAEDIALLLGNNLLVLSTLEALKELTLKHLAGLTGKTKEELLKEYTAIYTDTFLKLYADFVAKRGIA